MTIHKERKLNKQKWYLYDNWDKCRIKALLGLSNDVFMSLRKCLCQSILSVKNYYLCRPKSGCGEIGRHARLRI